jgi:hypothetical protein
VLRRLSTVKTIVVENFRWAELHGAYAHALSIRFTTASRYAEPMPGFKSCALVRQKRRFRQNQMAAVRFAART